MKLYVSNYELQLQKLPFLVSFTHGLMMVTSSSTNMQLSFDIEEKCCVEGPFVGAVIILEHNGDELP